MNWKDKRVLVFGAAKSGISATKLLQNNGANVILYDANEKLRKEDFKDKFDIENRFLLVAGDF